MQTQVGQDLLFAAKLLRTGELVALPTETVYGLAGNALNPDSLLKIFQVKNRPFFDPLIVHVNSYNDILPFVSEVPEWAKAAMEACWPGPLTILLPTNKQIPDLVNAGTGRTAFRSPSHPLFRKVLDLLDFPLAAPSANPFRYISPTKASHVYDSLKGKIPYILDGGDCPIGIESTIIGEENDQIICYRPGGLPLGQLEDVLGRKIETPAASEMHAAPGQSRKHYSPEKKVLVLQNPRDIAHYNPDENHLLWFGKRPAGWEQPAHFTLSESESSEEAAKNLFSMLRLLDEMDGKKAILAIALPGSGLGQAINDRLQRASGNALE